MSISSGIHVYVRHFDDAFITDEYRIKLTPHPLNWLSTINAMHQLFVANGATIDHDTFLRTLQVYLSIDGFLAKLNSRSIRWGLRENDHLVVRFSNSRTAKSHNLIGEDSVNVASKSTPEWDAIKAAKIPSDSFNYPVFISPHRNTPNLSKVQNITKRNRSISAKIKAIKLLLEYGVISSIDKDTLWHLILTNQSPALENALLIFQETGNADLFLTHWHQFQISKLKNDTSSSSFMYTDSIVEAFDGALITPQPLDSLTDITSTRRTLFDEHHTSHNHELIDVSPYLTASQVSDSSRYVYATTNVWFPNKCIPTPYPGKPVTAVDHFKSSHSEITDPYSYVYPRGNTRYSLTEISSGHSVVPSFSGSAPGLTKVPNGLETGRVFPQDIKSFTGTGKGCVILPKPYSSEEKKARIARWLKKREHRNWSNKPSYPLRHTIAMSRRRGEDGRFVPKDKNSSNELNCTLHLAPR
ncbi:hypothetical protein ABG067_004500 [Albugo candida]